MIFWDTHFLISYYIREKDLVYSHWKGEPDSIVFRESLTTTLDLLKAKSVKLYLSDQKKMGELSEVDRQYMVNVYLPEFLTINKLERAAVVLAEDHYARQITEKVLTAVKPRIGFELRYFRTVTEAALWLNLTLDDITQNTLEK